jgi:cellulose synthase/poly-beta-1,6-N-acetylglucosamine synthase-like glycosyltransferase
MARPVRKLLRRLADAAARPYVGELRSRSDGLQQGIDGLQRRIDQIEGMFHPIHVEVVAVRNDVRESSEGELAELRRTLRVLQHLDDEKAGNRSRLQELRKSKEYDLAFTEPDPLVSFIVPTYNRYEKLRDVALPSMLAQTHANIEIVVVGDCAPPETAEAIAAVGDPRIRYYNRPVRGPYPGDESVRWFMLGSPPYNDALSLVRGRWIAAMADDDEVRPDFAETLLAAAREGRHENCYGRHRVIYSGGDVLELGSFPPKKGEFVTQAAIYHSGLRFFQMSLADPLFEEPNDWSLCRRMMDAGVRFGMIDAIVCDKHESRYTAHSDWDAHGIPKVE